MSALLSDAALAPLRAVLVRGLSIDGIGIGGTSWIVETQSGDGEATAVTITDGATITAYLQQEQVTKASMAAPGVAVGDTQLLLLVTNGTVTVGQVVRSVDDGRRVRLTTQRSDPFYPTYLVEAL